MSENPAVQPAERGPVPIPANTPWLNVAEAAEYIRRKRVTMYKLISECKVPVYRPDSMPVLKKSDLDAYMEKQKVKRGK